MSRAGLAFPRRAAILLVAAILAVGAVPGAGIAAPVEGIAGWEGDGFDQGYGFAMIGTSLRRGEETSIPIRISGNYLYYNFAESGETIDVKGPGCAAMTGLRRAGAWGNVAALAGGEVRWERRERATATGPAGVVARGSVVAQVEGDFAWGKRVHPFVLANYSGSARYAYGRVGLRCQLSNLDWRGPLTWSIGLEGVGQGNSDTDAVQGGAAVECALVRSRISLSVRGGYKDSAASSGGRRNGGYLGIGFYRRF